MEKKEKVRLLRKAVAEKKMVHFDYVSVDLAVSYNRWVTPLEVTKWRDRHFLIGKDIDKKDNKLRQFDVDGINKLEIVEETTQ